MSLTPNATPWFILSFGHKWTLPGGGGSYPSDVRADTGPVCVALEAEMHQGCEFCRSRCSDLILDISYCRSHDFQPGCLTDNGNACISFMWIYSQQLPSGWGWYGMVSCINFQHTTRTSTSFAGFVMLTANH